MKSVACKWVFALLLLLTFESTLAANPTSWQTLAPGLEYARLSDFANFPSGYVHAFRIDLKQYDLEVSQLPKDLASEDGFTQVMLLKQAVLATNGGFFTPHLNALGLRISQGQLQNPLKSISWWGVFYTRGQQARLVRPSDFRASKDINFAVQAGPRLVVGGQVLTNLKLDIDDRTALGITRDGKVILLATQDLLLSTPELGTLMQRPEKEGGLNCQDALNLDGGSSTQFYTKLAGVDLQASSSSKVADAVLVVPKK